MQPLAFPLRCTQCNAQVVDRRSPTCTTCHHLLPANWVMTPEQVAKVRKIDPKATSSLPSLTRSLDGIWTQPPNRTS